MREIVKVLPGSDYVYFSDNAHCPYGEKDPEYILSRCRAITDMMLAKGVQVMVIACNTATAAAITRLRQSYGIPFIGMEPAIKPAALRTRDGIVGVLATAGTLKGAKYLGTKGRIGGKVKIVESVGHGFVELVEAGEFSGNHAEQVVDSSLRPLLEQGADTIVLGCTHYPFLVDTMKAISPAGTEFIDPAPSVAAHLLDVLEENGLSAAEGHGNMEFLCSGSIDTLAKLAGMIFNTCNISRSDV